MKTIITTQPIVSLNPNAITLANILDRFAEKYDTKNYTAIEVNQIAEKLNITRSMTIDEILEKLAEWGAYNN